MYKIYPGQTRNTTSIFIRYIHFVPPSDVSNAALIIFGNLEMTGFKAFDIHHQTAILGMEKLHQLTAAAYEDEYITVPDTAAHTLVYHTAEGTDTLAHISPAGAEKIPHRIIQTEHGNRCIG